MDLLFIETVGCNDYMIHIQIYVQAIMPRRAWHFIKFGIST